MEVDKATGQPDPNRPDLIGLRDRALVAVCLYSFARIEAALGMDVGDYGVWQRFATKWAIAFTIPSHFLSDQVRLQRRNANSEVPSSGWLRSPVSATSLAPLSCSAVLSPHAMTVWTAN